MSEARLDSSWELASFAAGALCVLGVLPLALLLASWRVITRQAANDLRRTGVHHIPEFTKGDLPLLVDPSAKHGVFVGQCLQKLELVLQKLLLKAEVCVGSPDGPENAADGHVDQGSGEVQVKEFSHAHKGGVLAGSDRPAGRGVNADRRLAGAREAMLQMCVEAAVFGLLCGLGYAALVAVAVGDAVLW